MKDKLLPSLTSIKVFEAAAQHLSFVRAARQLGVQSPAVSRQVAELEQALGARLFVRSKPRLALTPQGQELYLSISHGLNEIRQGCEKLQRERREGVVKVVTSIGITSCWLLNRLVGFYQQYPDIELHLTTRDSTTNLDPVDADVAILFGEDDLPGVETTLVFPEKMITVCAPGLLEERDCLSAEALLAVPLLHYAEVPHRDDWQQLLATADLTPPQPQRGMTFNSYVVYLQAALNGVGVAIGWEHLLDDYLDNGSLRRASALELESSRGYFCCLTVAGRNNAAARHFRDWICSLVD